MPQSGLESMPLTTSAEMFRPPPPGKAQSSRWISLSRGSGSTAITSTTNAKDETS